MKAAYREIVRALEIVLSNVKMDRATDYALRYQLDAYRARIRLEEIGPAQEPPR